MDDPGCPKYGDLYGVEEDPFSYYYSFDDDENSIFGTANDHCCHCENGMINTPVSVSKYLDVQ